MNLGQLIIALSDLAAKGVSLNTPVYIDDDEYPMVNEVNHDAPEPIDGVHCQDAVLIGIQYPNIE